mmetsp:Transcript_2550/g.9864  ORF Transcript_2550/g.9864 Transcript_2550/m.9864 type:complete len:284 (+) Transcript_2550:2437-3288(+)
MISLKSNSSSTSSHVSGGGAAPSPPLINSGIVWTICVFCFDASTSSKNAAIAFPVNAPLDVANRFLRVLTTVTQGASGTETSNAPANDLCCATSTITNFAGRSRVKPAAFVTASASFSFATSAPSFSGKTRSTNATTHSGAAPHASSNCSVVSAKCTSTGFFALVPELPEPSLNSFPSTCTCTMTSHWCICWYARFGAGYAAAAYCDPVSEFAAPDASSEVVRYSKRIAGRVVTPNCAATVPSVSPTEANKKSSWKFAASAVKLREGRSPFGNTTSFGVAGEV